MKRILLALCAFLAVATARVLISAEEQDTPHLLGAKACTWGPSYWCQNITTAAGCKATKHCIKTVWEKLEVPEDNDSVCDICKDMVTQARDQLESNQTQEDLKMVFEGSCALIHIKPIVQECDKLVDQFIPELVETLASQMNPSVVCSVAGLCNSPHIDELLLSYQETMTEGDEIVPKSLANDELEPDECSKCYTIATHMEHKLSETSRDRLLENMLTRCGQVGSFSDACSSIILTYFDTIYSHLISNFKAENICHLSGQCSQKFHKHEDDADKEVEVEVRPLSSVGMVEVGDELPCKLCEQLVGHLRDLLVANTTEIEFEHVLEGLCKQTKTFATECKQIVEEYYPEIYSYLTKGLNGNVVCQMAGICPSPDAAVINGPIWPLLPEQPAQIGIEIMNKKKNENAAEFSEYVKTEAEEMQLPLERMTGPVTSLVLPAGGVEGKQACALCEYLLHYIQIAITDPITEDNVKAVIGKICQKLPESIENDCTQFVDTYGDAVVAILAQEIDPSQVCPMMHVCPSAALMEAWEAIPKDMVITSELRDKPGCALCLLAIEQLYTVVKDNRTEASITAALENLCTHLPQDLIGQCKDLVDGYSKELVEMMMADLTPQEVCVYIKLCTARAAPVPTKFFPTDKSGEIMTNEIPYFPLHPVVKQPENVASDTKCALCEFVMQYVEKSMKNKKTKDEVEHLVHNVCNYLPKTISKECNDFVDKYADLVIELLINEADPKDICTAIGLCQAQLERIQESIAECALCQTVISTIDKMLEDPKVDHEIEMAVSRVCKFIPATKQDKCNMMIEVYGQSIINMLTSMTDSKKICAKIALCSEQDFFAMKASRLRIARSPDLGVHQCTWGPSYWCSTDETANQCNAVKHCQDKYWKAESAAAAKQAAAL